jgi:Family of unknown function (DUF5681)
VNNENLEKGEATRFKPGVSGNPGGRPRKRAISDRLQEKAETVLPEKLRILHGLPEGVTYADATVLATFRSAIKGRTEAGREVREAIEGKTGPRKEKFEPEERNDVKPKIRYMLSGKLYETYEEYSAASRAEGEEISALISGVFPRPRTAPATSRP